MKLDENNCREIIASYTYDKWRPLLDLIPEIYYLNGRSPSQQLGGEFKGGY
jgi:hypothetical protein